MVYVLVVVAFALGGSVDGGSAVHVTSVRFQSQSACETAAAFAREEFSYEPGRGYRSFLQRRIRATCVPDTSPPSAE